APPESGRAYFVFCNQVGLPERIEDAQGREAWRAEDIDPYGLIRVAEGNTLEYDLRWPGHWFERETGLHCNRFRVYCPRLGRYLQSDPMGLAGGINLYGYALNPLTTIDVFGLAHGKRKERALKGATRKGEEFEDTDLPSRVPPRHGFPGWRSLRRKDNEQLRQKVREANIPSSSTRGRSGSVPNNIKSTEAVTISGKRAIDLGHSYEKAIRELYGDVP
ncbi:RHS repeat domain-containing protein, partial [Pseudomonas indica]|uniref:RHS repeat domain-containing protein n=1 Tax=Pseudomonas indica TaxID=137658 RepID=UPI0023F97443